MKKKKKNFDLEELARQNQNYQPEQIPPHDPYLNGYYESQQIDPHQNQEYANGRFYGAEPTTQSEQKIEELKVNPQRSRLAKSAVKEPTDEEIKFKSKLRKRYALRGLLIVVNLALVAYLVFETTNLVKTQIKKNEAKKQEYINLLGSSKKTSEILYQKYCEDGYKSVFDYAIVGQYLFLSENRIEANQLSNISDLQLVQVKNDGTQDVILDKNLYFDLSPSDFSSGIDLFSDYIKEGDYLVYERSTVDGVEKCHPLKVQDLELDYTLYSLPDKDNVRRRVNIRNTPSNKALVIRVEKVKTLPSDYYDMVITTPDQNYDLPDSLTDYRIKLYRGEDYLKEAFKTKANYAVLADSINSRAFKSQFDGSATYSSSETISDGRLSGFDRHDFIRELTGYVQSAGQGYTSVDGIDNHSVSQFVTPEHVGKLAYVFPTTILQTEVIKLLD